MHLNGFYALSERSPRQQHERNVVFGTPLVTQITTACSLPFDPVLSRLPSSIFKSVASEVASKTLAAAWAKLEARQHAWKEEPGIRDDMRRSIIDEVGLLDSNSLSFPENLQGAICCKMVQRSEV